jgi:tetratricopeptide (TPR) repeat protein
MIAASSTWSGTPFEEGIELYQKNSLKDALPNLELAVKEEQRNPDAHAYLAETLRRLGRKREAVKHARNALAIEPCHSFAHTVIADASNPMFGIWEGSNEDSTWHHLLKAIECDPKDGNAWTGIWVEAMRRGEDTLEVRAASALLESGFLASPILAYNRWVLSNLPENALLLTNGDMDTYPAIALQQVEELRRDVCVVNISLLNLPWYARLVDQRCGISLPFKDAEMETLRSYRTKEGTVVTSAQQIIAGWLDKQKEGKFTRPIAPAATISNLDFTPDSRKRMRLAGPFYICHRESLENPVNRAIVQAALTNVNPNHFKGPWVSSMDRSPVRRASTHRVGTNIAALAVRYSYILLDSDRSDEALVWAEWADSFDREMYEGPHMAAEIAELRKKITGKQD